MATKDKNSVQEIKIKTINIELFQEFLTRLINFDDNVYIKLDSEDTTSSVNLPTSGAAKMTTVKTADLFEFEEPLTEEFRISFHNIRAIISDLSSYIGTETTASFEYSVFRGKNNVVRFIVKNSSERSNLFCIDPNMSFSWMEKSSANDKFSTATVEEKEQKLIGTVKLDFETISKIKSKIGLNKVETKFVLKFVGTKVFVSTQNKEILVSEEAQNNFEDVSMITLQKRMLTYLDKENYLLNVCTNKVVFESTISDTKIAIPTVASNDLIDEIDEDDFTEDFSELIEIDLD